MTRIFLPLLLFLIPFTSYGQYPNKAMFGLVVVEVLPQKFQREIFSGIMPMAT